MMDGIYLQLMCIYAWDLRTSRLHHHLCIFSHTKFQLVFQNYIPMDLIISMVRQITPWIEKSTAKSISEPILQVLVMGMNYLICIRLEEFDI